MSLIADLIGKVYHFSYTTAQGNTSTTWFLAKHDTNAENKMRMWALAHDVVSWKLLNPDD